MKKRLFLLAVAVLSAVAFLGFTLLVKADRLTQMDFNTTVRLQNHLPLKFSPIFIFFSFLGRFEIMLLLLIILLFLRKSLWGLLAVFVFAAGHVVELIGKVFLHQPPPPFMFYRGKGFFQFSANYIQQGASYPSGHAMRAIFVGLFILYFTFRNQKFSALTRLIIMATTVFVVGIIGLSKVVLGEHWPTDVIGGYLVGIVGASFSLIFLL